MVVVKTTSTTFMRIKMYSVIIPTMWRQNLNDFVDVLRDLNQSQYVEEIILIDNEPAFDNTVKTQILSDIDKLRHLRMEQNIYVNPAWNLGVKSATGEYVMVLNDDVWSVPPISSIFPAHQSHFDKESGIYGLSTSCFLCDDVRHSVPEENINIVNTEGRGTGWGCLFLLRRDSWKEIPDELKVWFGDDYITKEFNKEGKTVYSIKNLCVTEWSITSRNPEFSPVTENDKEIYFSKYSN